MRIKLVLASIAAFAVYTAAAASSPDAQMDEAFRTAFGSSPNVVRQVVRPRQTGRIHVPSAPVTLSLRPSALMRLGDGSYVLVVLEDDTLGAHVDPGAVAVAHLRHDHGQWTALKVWPELAWTGNDGHAADAVSVERFGGRPLALLNSDYLGQGQHTVSDWIVDLGPRAPSLLGVIPIGGSLTEEDGGCDRCSHYDYKGHVKAGSSAGELLSVRYTGWTKLAGGPNRKSPFTRKVTFALREGKFVATSPLSLPDWRLVDAPSPR